MESNLRGCWHGHLRITTTVDDYMAQTGYAFVSPHNPSNYLPIMGITQEQALGTERLRQNQALLRRCTAMDGALKNQTVMAVQPVLLYLLEDQLTGFRQVTMLKMTQHLFNSYGAIDEIYLEENAVKTMGPHDPAKPSSPFN